MATRRTNIQIIVEMLKLARRGAGKTELMYQVNMSHIQKERYLDYLTDKGLLEALHPNGRSKSLYRTTDRGNVFLHDISKMSDVLELDLE